MKKTLLIFIFSVCYLFQANAQWLSGSGNVTKETRNLIGFHAIHARSGVDVYISKGNTEAVSVEADDNLLPLIKTEVRDGILEIWHEKSFMKTTRLRVFITVKNLDNIEAQGGSDVFSEGTLELSTLVCRAMGGSDVKLQINANSLEMHIEGGSDATLSGKVGTFVAHATGGSDLKAKELIADDCDIYASGGSDAHIYAGKNLKIKASGGSDVHYLGNPASISTNASGGSDIHPRN